MRAPTKVHVTLAAFLLAAVLGATLAATGRHFVNPDGISYLDLSDDFARGRWSSAVNGHWSPLYPFLLAQWLQLTEPASWWEASLVHVLNALLFIAAFFAFELFLRELRRASSTDDAGLTPAMDLDTPGGRACAWSLFLWGSLVLITIKVVTPDMFLAAIGFLAAALVLRIESGRANLITYIALGATLGLAYLTKSFMFPVSLALLAISWLASRRRHGSMPEEQGSTSHRSAMTTDYASTRGHLIAALAFGLVALPQVLALTRSTGRLQFSDSGRIAYALKVNRYPKLWVGKPPGSGTPVNPIEVLASSPVTFVFPLDKPSRTYPVWAEPSHWYEGMKPRFDVADQIRGLRRSVMIDFGIAAKVLIPLLIIWLLRDRRSRTRHRILIAISALVLIAYAFLHSEARLIGLWLVLGITSVLAGTSLDRRSPRGRVASALVHAITVISSISFITYVADQIYTAGPGKAMHNAPHLQWKVARTLGSLGVARGSRVALVGDDSDIYWARLSGVQVAVQIPLSEATRYWQMPAESRSQLEQRIAGTGAAAIVASWTSPAAPLPGWIPVEGTRYSILPLDRNEPTQ